MNFIRNPGRFAGLLYVAVSIPAGFALVYVPNTLIVSGNATATAANIAGSETLYRLAIGTELIGQVLFMGVALALYDLLKGVNRRQALVMVALIAAGLPIAMLNELNALAALVLIRGPDFLSAIDKPQRDALAMMFIHLHSRGFDIAEIFWGLWLFPLGLLVYRSGFIPRFLGILLIANGCHFLVICFTSLVFPPYRDEVARWIAPFHYGEILFMLWLSIMGATPTVRRGVLSQAAAPIA